jgi:hypothetical protein
MNEPWHQFVCQWSLSCYNSSTTRWGAFSFHQIGINVHPRPSLDSMGKRNIMLPLGIGLWILNHLPLSLYCQLSCLLTSQVFLNNPVVLVIKDFFQSCLRYFCVECVVLLWFLFSWLSCLFSSVWFMCILSEYFYFVCWSMQTQILFNLFIWNMVIHI